MSKNFYEKTILSGQLSDAFYTQIITNMMRSLSHFFFNSEQEILKDDKTDFAIKKKLLLGGLVKYYNRHQSRGSHHLSALYPIPEEEIEKIFPNTFSKYDSFVVFGCPESTDIDIACFVDEKFNVEGCPRPMFASEEERLKRELVELGYDLSRGLDVVVLIVSKGRLAAMSKGGNMIANVITATYRHHQQKYQLIPINFIPTDRMDALSALSKLIIDKLEFFAKDYPSLRPTKMEAYEKGAEDMAKMAISLDPKTQFHLSPKTLDQKIKPEQWVDRTKALTVKLIQFILLETDQYLYTKRELAESVERMNPGYGTFAEWFLFRGKKGTYSDDLIPYLYAKAMQFAIKVVTEYNKIMTPVVVKLKKSTLPNTTRAPQTLFDKFLESPYAPTEVFEKEWIAINGDTEMNRLFQIDCSQPQDQQVFLSKVPAEKRSQFIWMPQRCPEWLSLYRFYTCGLHSKQVADTMDAKYNLIRGCIGELIMMRVFDPEVILPGFRKYSLGFIVEQYGVRESPGCAPDLILQNSSTGEIIPVEMKMLKKGSRNGEYRRAVHLATHQCQSVKNIINDRSVRRGVIILSWFEGDDFEMNYFMVPI
jgi:hypothetical protein